MGLRSWTLLPAMILAFAGCKSDSTASIVPCGGGGVPGACGTTAAPDGGTTVRCIPKTCQELGASCGMVGDGCNGVLDCGSCSAPATCGGAATPFACGAPPPPVDAGPACTA